MSKGSFPKELGKLSKFHRSILNAVKKEFGIKIDPMKYHFLDDLIALKFDDAKSSSIKTKEILGYETIYSEGKNLPVAYMEVLI
ncbi:MAG: hypothetical protein OEY49_18865 [Candidatus Heimdallarchaeota archaeon]|nr:hypothetical protein [Candidatus Heimdallarchaeota archaeon]